MAGKNDIAAMSFEAALAALEEIVAKLESGETALEDSIALYERGALLRRHCEAKLSDAEMRVEKIVQGEAGKATGTTPLDTPAPAAAKPKPPADGDDIPF